MQPTLLKKYSYFFLFIFIQLTVNPSFNDEKDVIAVFSVFRMRYAL